MKLSVSKNLFNPIRLPGMGRSIELSDLSQDEIAQIRQAFLQKDLFVEFNEEPGTSLQVLQLWANPHSPQITLFV